MPPLLSPSPNLIDQSFPRNVAELQSITSALQRITEGVHEGTFSFLLTLPLRTFLQDGRVNFDWTKISEFQGLHTVYSALAQLGLQQAGVEVIDLSGVGEYRTHPLPRGTEPCPSAAMWADEIGRLRSVHDGCLPRDGTPFVGVACTTAFSGGCVGCYDNPQNEPCLPLVGPKEVEALSDSEEWDVDPGCRAWIVTFDEAKRNVKLLGGQVRKPGGSSHYEVKFSGQRTWPLDHNYREVPDPFLKELIPITGLPIEVIKYTLREGERPKRRKRLVAYLSALR